MLTDALLVVEVRKVGAKSRRLAVLLLLAHIPQPAKTRAIGDKAVAIGFRPIKDWNVSELLSVAERGNEVARLPGGWQLLDPGLDTLASVGVNLSIKPPPAAPSNAVLPRELFENTRGYIERVGVQINGSYDQGFYDCCAVMCRRMAETLIIEIYESQGRADELKGDDDHFHMLSGLLGVFLNDRKFHLGRNTKNGLQVLKAMGDKSAHSRKFNARQADIDALRADFRAGVEEMLHLAKLIE